jgi:predicted transcriptional regulator
MEQKNTIELTAQIVAAYVAKHDVARPDIARLIADVHAALSGLADGKLAAVGAAPKLVAKNKKSIFPDYLVCLEDGQRFKSLKRHLRVKYALTPEQYRAKWNLAADYPMVAPNYAKARSKLAMNMGLGKKPRKRSR